MPVAAHVASDYRARTRRTSPYSSRRATEHLGILAAYAVLAIVLSHPLVLAPHRSIPMDPHTEGWFPGDGDPWHYLWGIWYVGRAFSTFPPPLLWTDLVFFPIGWDIPFLPGVGLVLGPGALLRSIFGLVLAYNVLWWLSFALAGYATYLLVQDLVADRTVAFVCGCLFAFSSYRQIHSVEHLPILLASFLVPLFALAVLRAARQPTSGRCGWCALVLAASAGISWYCTIALLVFLAVSVPVLSWPSGFGALRAIRLAPLVTGLVVFVVAASPFVLPLILSPARDSIVDRPLAESIAYSADLLAFFLPSPRNPLFGGLTGSLYERFTGNPHEQTVYLGYVLLGLAVLGLRSTSPTTTRLFRVSAATAFVLALGPFLHIGGAVSSVPLPYLILHHIPGVRGARVPSRFTELLVLSLIVLAGYGLARARERVGARGKAWLATAVLVAALLETTLAPLPVVSAAAPAVYGEIGRSPEPGTVLDLPLDTRIIKYHYYQTIHELRMVGGNPVRPRDRYADYPRGMPLIPLLRDPTLLVDRPDPPDARRDAERLVEFFEVRHVVIHGEYLDPRAFRRLDRFVAENFPHTARTVDGMVVTYRLRRPDPPVWPERYVVDFGSEPRAFVLSTGWSANERGGPGGPTFQWANDRESSLVLALGAPVDRVLELRILPLTYPGSPPQTLSLDVNGVPRARLVLEPNWAVYRVAVPAASFKTGLNWLTFRYGRVVAPARVVAGSSDERPLAVAFDVLELGPAR